MILRVVASLVLATGIARAEAADCAQEAAELHRHLESEASRARTWNIVWAILYGAAAVGQATFVVLETDPLGGDYDNETRDTLLVGTSKATLAVGSKFIFPLRIPAPALTGDACADVAVQRKALATAAKHEKRSFWLTHIGGTVINLAGATILTARHSFKTGAISFAISYPVGPASAYTQPRKSWKLDRERQPTWTVGASANGDGGTLWLGGQW